MKTERAQIIFLHGASSSGKSTLAKALQNALPVPFWHISIDHLRDSGVLPSHRFKNGDFDWAQSRPNFFVGYHRSLAAYAEGGNNLILEHILDEKVWLDQLVALFAPYDVLFVGLHCPPEILEQREINRGDRQIGSALQDYVTIHEGLTYDLELQALDPIESNVKKVIEAWKDRTGPSLFARRLELLRQQDQRA